MKNIENAVIIDDCPWCNGTGRDDQWGTCGMCHRGERERTVSFCGFCGGADCQCGEDDEQYS